jgi:putative restriction endonuclease
VTGEHSLPVLDAAHIQPYLGPSSNHVQNGLVLRTDIHRLYDAGYVTVTPDLRFHVSQRLRDDYENGRVYYELDGAPLKVVPRRRGDRPNEAALAWHATKVFM